MAKKLYAILTMLGIMSLPLAASAIDETSHRYSFFDNKHGLNDKANPISVDDGQATSLQNVIFSTDGSIIKRSGYTEYNSPSIPGNEALTGLYYFRKSNGDQWLVATTTNQNVFTSTNVAGGAFTRITGTASWTDAQDTYSSFDTARDILVFTTGDSTKSPFKWDTTDAVKQAIPLGGSPPSATMVKYFKNFLFTAGDSTAPSTLRFSNIGAVENWDAGDGIDVNTNDGSPITALWVQLDGLYIGKRQAIFRLDGTSRNNFIVQKLVEGIGPINHQSVQVINNTAYFAAPNGHIYQYDGGINAVRLSDRITGTINGLNLSRTNTTTAGTRDREYWLSCTASGGSTNNRILMYDPITDSWTKFVGIRASALAWAYDSAGSLQFYTGGYNGLVYKQRDGNSDDGQAISGIWQSKQFRFPDIPSQKRLMRIKSVLAVEGNWNLTTQVRGDFEGSGTTRTTNLSAGGSVWNTMVWGTGVWGGRTDFIDDQPLEKISDFFQVQYENDNANEPFEVRGYTVDVSPTGRP